MYENMDNVWQHGRDVIVPLQSLKEKPEAEKFRAAYVDWISRSDFARDLCFLDVTFFEASWKTRPDPARAYSLAVARDETATHVYMQALSKLFLGDKSHEPQSTSGHKVFQEGLPLFRTGIGKTEGPPSTAQELDELIANPASDVIGDSFVYWARETPDSPPKEELERREQTAPGAVLAVPFPSLHGHLFETYTTSNPKKINFDDLSKKPFEKTWKRYVDLVLEEEALLSPQGLPVAQIVGAPIGIRSRESPKNFLRLADIYFGLSQNSACASPGGQLSRESLEFLRMLVFQLYRANLSLIRREATLQSSYIFGHEIKHIALGISEHWMQPAENLFEVHTLPRRDFPSRPSPGTGQSVLGQIYLDSDFGWLQPELGVVPFRQLLLSTGEVMRTWCLLKDLDDDLLDVRSATSLREFLHRCLEHARSLMVPHLLSGLSAQDAATIVNFKRCYDALKTLFCLQQAPIPQGDVDEIMLYPTDERTWLGRVFIATFKGCFQHGHPLSPIIITVASNKEDSFTVQIQNRKRGKSDKEMLALLTSMEQLGMSKQDARLALNLLIIGSESLGVLGRRFGTRDVLELCLQEINGRLVEITGDELDPYRVVFACPIWGRREAHASRGS